MNKFLKLLKINIISALYQMNILGNKGKNRRGKTIAVAAALLGVVIVAYVALYTHLILSDMPQQLMPLVPLAVFIMAGVFVLFSGLFTSTSLLFKSKDLSQLSTYPIGKNVIIGSKITALIIENVIFFALIMVPCLAVYSLHAAVPVLFYPAAILSIFIMPLVPMAIAVFISFICNVFSLKRAYKNLVNTGVTLLVAAVLLFFIQKAFSIMSVSFFGVENLISFTKLVFPPLGFLMGAVTYGSFLDLLISILISLVVFSVVIAFIAHFHKNVFSEQNIQAKSKKRPISLNDNGALVSLLKKEFSKYFSSSIYVLNTIIGIILMTLFSIASIVPQLGLSEFLELIPAPKAALIMLFFGFLLAMTNTTCSSISLEGKSLWIMKTIPQKPLTILLSKFLVQMAICLPALFIDTLLVSIAFGFNIFNYLSVVIICSLISVTNALFGLIANLYFHRFDFINDAQMVKNGLPVLLSLLFSYVLIIIMFVMFMLLPYHLFIWLSIFMLLIITAAFSLFLKSNAGRLFKRL